jgi:hypothetical protein
VHCVAIALGTQRDLSAIATQCTISTQSLRKRSAIASESQRSLGTISAQLL